jgi:hypothetical protein
MKDIIELAREAGLFTHKEVQPELQRFSELVRADERNSWPDEMEAMERQVNILTDALASEREECAKVIESHGPFLANGAMLADAIRARGNT